MGSGGGGGGGSRGASRHRRAPSGTDAQHGEESQAAASVAHRPARLSPPRPGLARAGCRGFCSQGPSPSPGESEGASERPQCPGLEKVRGGCGCPTPPISLNLTQKGDAEMYKVCLRRVLCDPACWGRTRAAAPSSREEEGGGRRSGREGVVGMRR